MGKPEYHKIHKDDMKLNVTCDCGHTAIMFPFGNPAMHKCFECGSTKAFKEVKEFIYAKYRHIESQ